MLKIAYVLRWFIDDSGQVRQIRGASKEYEWEDRQASAEGESRTVIV